MMKQHLPVSAIHQPRQDVQNISENHRKSSSSSPTKHHKTRVPCSKSSPEEGVSLSPRLQVMHTQWSRNGKEARSGSEWALSLKRLAYGWYMLV